MIARSMCARARAQRLLNFAHGGVFALGVSVSSLAELVEHVATEHAATPSVNGSAFA